MAQIFNRDPVEGLVQYIQDIKPYHTKVISVLVEYIHTDPVDITITEDLQFKIEETLNRYDPACPTGWDMFHYDELSDEPPLFNLDIIDADTVLNTFSIGGDQTNVFHPGQTFQIQGSVGNDGNWTTSSSTYTPLSPTSGFTTITVLETVTSTDTSGTISIYISEYDVPETCATISEGEVRASFAESLSFDFGSEMDFYDLITATICDHTSARGWGGFTKEPVTVNPSTNIFSFTDPEQVLPIAWQTGYPVYFISSGTLPSPLVASTVYYLIRLSSTTFKLATSYVNSGASGGPVTSIDITTAGTGIHWIGDVGDYEAWDTCSFDAQGAIQARRYIVDDITNILTTVNFDDNVPIPHPWETGDVVLTSTTGTFASPLVADTRYYVIKISDTELQLALSPTDASNNTPIDLTTSGSGAHFIEQKLPFMDMRFYPGDTVDATLPESINSEQEIIILPSNVGSIGSNASTAITESLLVAVTSLRLAEFVGVGITEEVTGNVAMAEGVFIGSYDYPYFDVGAFDEDLRTASNSLGYTYMAPGGAGGLLGQYWSNQLGTFTGDPTLTRVDENINFDWGAGSPDVSISTDQFTVRWTGFINPAFSETYTFYTTSDDGIRVWVNGELIINNWTVHGPAIDSGTIDLLAGYIYPITVEFFEDGGGAVITLEWESTSQTRQIVPSNRLYPGV